MRTAKELADIAFNEWSDAEVIRAALDGTWPPQYETQLRNLAASLPRLDKRYREERLACDEILSASRNNSFAKEWDKELKSWKALLDTGLKLGTERELWHKKGAVCSKCDEPLQEMDTSLCIHCKGGRTPSR